MLTFKNDGDSNCVTDGAQLVTVVASQRKKLGLSQGQLARKVGCAQAQICKFETGQVLALNPVVGKVLRILGLEVVVVPVHMVGRVNRLIQAAGKTARNAGNNKLE